MKEIAEKWVKMPDITRLPYTKLAHQGPFSVIVIFLL